MFQGLPFKPWVSPSRSGDSAKNAPFTWAPFPGKLCFPAEKRLPVVGLPSFHVHSQQDHQSNQPGFSPVRHPAVFSGCRKDRRVGKALTEPAEEEASKTNSSITVSYRHSMITEQPRWHGLWSHTLKHECLTSEASSLHPLLPSPGGKAQSWSENLIKFSENPLVIQSRKLTSDLLSQAGDVMYSWTRLLT